MWVKNLGQENGFWFQVNLETNPPILIVSDPKTQKQEFVFGKLGKNQKFWFDLKKFIANVYIEINKYKSVYWYKNGRIHREDGPAVIYADGDQMWYKNGQCHREDEPAAIQKDGSEFWYKNGKLHREDGPAIVYVDGTKRWYLNDVYYSEQEWEKTISKNRKSNQFKT